MLDIDKHRTLLYQILKDVFESDIWKYLSFKGWTASYFLYGLERFSTDLDFDLLDTTKNVDKKLTEILKKYGQVKKWKQLILNYGNDDVNIKIDINRNVLKSANYDFVNFYGTTIKIQDKASIFANKLLALNERNVNRDIYDVYFFFKNLFPINEEMVEEATWKTLKELFIRLKQKLENLPKNSKILSWLWEVLNNKQKAFMKEKLLKELIGILEMKINF